MSTYWDNSGKYQALADKLQAILPRSGTVEKPWKNKELERFRKAANAYYDTFNNGGMNRARSIGKLFPGVMSLLRWRAEDNRRGFYTRERDLEVWNNIHEITEPAMDAIILAAAQEQGIVE